MGTNAANSGMNPEKQRRGRGKSLLESFHETLEGHILHHDFLVVASYAGLVTLVVDCLMHVAFLVGC